MRGANLLPVLGIALLCVNALALAAAPDSPSPTTSPTSHARHHHRYRHPVRHRYPHRLRRVSSGPHLRSSEVLVLDETHSKVLYARRADVPQPIASISKLMTAMVVLDARQPLDQVLEVTRADRARGRGAFDRLRVGTRLTRSDLLHLALMASDNRAAHALGRNYPGGIRALVRAMNEKARVLGMRTAHFVEPTGLSSANVASPADLAKLVAAAAKYPLIREYSTAHHYTVWVGGPGRHRRQIEFATTDPLVANRGWKIVVQKTGFITPAGKCLVMQALIDHRSVVMVLLNSWGKYTRVADARRVRRWVKARLSERAVRTGHSTV
jgi:serine-type D-Ala-D-Ala endopeptidase (penicillin-binding protein 7)